MNKKLKIFFIGTAAASFLLGWCFFLHNAKAEENTSEESVSCNQEIPIGELIEETVGFMGVVRSDAIDLQSLLRQEITASERLISSVQSCDTNKCTPSCKLVTLGLPNGMVISNCEAGSCGGEICPEDKINSNFENIQSIYNDIETAQKTAKNNIEKKDFSFSVKPYLNPFLPIPIGLYPDISNKTRSETIQAKLNASRGLFDSCFSTPQEWQEVMEGSKLGKALLSCQESLDFVKDDLSQECKDACSKADCKSNPKGSDCSKCIKCLGCKSPGNFFCCTTK
jgi:hypothetical protein